MDDDQHAFFDRALGTITNVGYRIQSASLNVGNRGGHLTAGYDTSGNMTSLTVHREEPCVPATQCNDQHFEYRWDERGKLVKAQRWDVADWQNAMPAVTMDYAYDAAGMRVRKTVTAAGDIPRHTIYVFD